MCSNFQSGSSAGVTSDLWSMTGLRRVGKDMTGRNTVGRGYRQGPGVILNFDRPAVDVQSIVVQSIDHPGCMNGS